MCMSKPKVPDAPPPPQPAKEADTAALRDRMRRAHSAGLAGGTLMTSAQGAGQPATAKATLLGG